MPNLTIDELKATDEFRALRPRQASCLLSLLVGCNRVEAVKLAYNISPTEDARKFSYKFFSSVRVKKALARYRGEDPDAALKREEIASLKKRIAVLNTEIFRDVRNPKVPVDRVTAKRNVLKDLQAQLEKVTAPATKVEGSVTIFEGPDEPPEGAAGAKKSTSRDPDEMFQKVQNVTRKVY